VTVRLIGSLVTAFALGSLALVLAWPGRTRQAHRLLIATFALPLGTGLCAVLVFPWLMLAGPSRLLPTAELVLIAGLAIPVVWRLRFGAPEPRSTLPSWRVRPNPALAVAFLVVAVAALGSFLATSREHPHGDWDAWMDWNLRARMILRGGADWQTAFTGLLPWSHPDYPLLLQSSVVRSWLYAGQETQAGPALVALTFTFATVAVLVASLWSLRSPNQGILAGLVLLGTPLFLVQGAAQYADIPLACFLLLVVVFLALHAYHGDRARGFAALAGFSAGLAIWTKNEAATFVLALVAAHLFVALRQGRPALTVQARAFAAGFAPVLCLVLFFKLRLAPPNDLISGLGIERTLSRLATPERYQIIAREFKNRIAGFGSNGLVSATWLVVAYILAAWTSPRARDRSWVRTAAIAILLVLVGHGTVYLTMSDDLTRHLNNSLDRLLLQLWPAVVFLAFMTARTPEEAAEDKHAPGGFESAPGPGSPRPTAPTAT
jgi:hypothetical protein